MHMQAHIHILQHTVCKHLNTFRPDTEFRPLRSAPSEFPCSACPLVLCRGEETELSQSRHWLPLRCPLMPAAPPPQSHTGCCVRSCALPSCWILQWSAIGCPRVGIASISAISAICGCPDPIDTLKSGPGIFLLYCKSFLCQKFQQ